MPCLQWRARRHRRRCIAPAPPRDVGPTRPLDDPPAPRRPTPTD